MPKLIANVKETILKNAKEELYANPEADLNLRNIAKKSGIAVGTIYHYFDNKLQLVATIILDEWNGVYSAFLEKEESFDSLETLFREIIKMMNEFSKSHRIIFDTYSSKEHNFNNGHKMFRNAIKNLIVHYLVAKKINYDESNLLIASELITRTFKDDEISKEPLYKTLELILIGGNNNE